MGNNFQIEDKILGENGQLKLSDFQGSYLSILDFYFLVNLEKDHIIIDSELLQCARYCAGQCGVYSLVQTGL